MWSDKPQRRDEMADGLVGYLAPEGFLPQLQEELGSETRETYGNLVLAPTPAKLVAWAANVWHDPQRLEIASIGDAANKLRAIQRNWRSIPSRITGAPR